MGSQSIAAPLDDPTRSWDIIKLFLGSFAGAGSALLVARLNDARKLRRENLASGNLALLTLRDQINDFLEFPKRFRHDVANPTRGPSTPVYMLVQPDLHAYTESGIDFSSLSFLMERRKHIPKLNSLVFSAKLYRNLVKLDGFRNDAVLALQEKLAEVESTKPARTVKDIERVAGPLLTANATAAIVALVTHARDDEPIYRQAVAELREALIDTLGPWWWPDWLRKRYPKVVKEPALISFTFGDLDMQEDAMPPWPKQLLEVIAEQDVSEEERSEAIQPPVSFVPTGTSSLVTYRLILRKVT